MSDCPPQEQLEQLLAEELTAEQRESLEEHLAGCPACQQRLAELTRDPLTEWWRQDQQGSDPSGPAPGHGLFLKVHQAQLLDVPPLHPSRDLKAAVQPTTPLRPRLGYGPDSHLPSVPGYEVIAELGRGGMAVVYKARQLGLDRLVALKMMQGEERTDEPKGGRLLRAEAQAIARLRHPHIVQIHDIGEHDGHLYLSLEYLDGGSLAQRLDGKPQPPRAAAQLIAVLARTVQNAHECGIVHRDLKPANILLQENQRVNEANNPTQQTLKNFQDETLPGYSASSQTWDSGLGFFPKIADFGLAKRLDGAATLFASGTILGTPAYMAPEQVSGLKGVIGPAVDIYALGIILYEMLTGRPPFRGENSYDTLLQVVHQEPVPPRRLQPKIPVDLETVCLTCLHKEPHKRYASAAAFAEDLERFLSERPIHARPVGRLERTVKWARRHPAGAGLFVLILLLVVSAFPLLLWQLKNAEERVATEKQARRQVERLSARDLFHQGNTLCEKGQIAAGLLSFTRALELAVDAEDADLEHVLRANLSEWRHRLVRKRAMLHHYSPIWAVAYSPNGERAATGGGSTLADGENVVRLWDVATGQQLGEPLRHERIVCCLAFSPDGTKLLTGTCTDSTAVKGPFEICLWDVESGKRLHRWSNDEEVHQVAFVGKGDRFVSLSPPAARLWDLQSDRPVAELHQSDPVLSLAWSRDGQTLATGSTDGRVRLWNATDGRPRGAPLFNARAFAGPVLKLAFHPDGQTLAAAIAIVPISADGKHLGASWGEVRLWNVVRARPTGVVMRHRGTIQVLAFSPDGSLLATGNAIHDWPRPLGELAAWGEAQLWDAKTGEQWGRPMLHPRGITALAFSPDSRLLLTGAEDGKARLFTVSCGEPIEVPHHHEGSVMSLAFSPDGRTALTGSAGGDNVGGTAAGLWELPAEIGPIRRLPASRGGRIAAISPNGDLLLTGDWFNKSVLGWAIPAARPVAPIQEHPDGLNALSFTADGQTIITCCRDHKVRLWDRAGGRQLHEFRHDRWPMHAALSPDGHILLTLTDNNVLRFWDLASGQCRQTRAHQGGVLALAFRLDGHAVWLERDGKDQMAWMWSWAAGEEVKQLWHRSLPCSRACFAPDARTVLVFGSSQSPQLIDTQTGQPCGPALRRHREGIVTMAVHDSGRMVLVGGGDRSARLWDAATGLPLGPPLRHHQPVIAGAFSPTALLLVTSDTRGTYLWPLPAPIVGTPAHIRLWMEVLTGMELDASGTLRDLEPATLEQRRSALRDLGGSPEPMDQRPP
jgi:WD40 repeat protein/serine/threonine protein kinase